MEADNFEDDFSDDGFDALPPSTLLQLEQKAFAATQQQQSQQAPKPQLNPQTVPQPRINDSGARRNPAHHGSVLQQPAVINLASSDYGDLDVGELDAGVLDDGEGSVPIEETGPLLVPGRRETAIK